MRVSLKGRLWPCVLLFCVALFMWGCGTKKPAAAATIAPESSNGIENPTIDQIIWYQAVDHQPTKIFLHAPNLPLYMKRAGDWIEQNQLEVASQTETRLESSGGEKGNWDYRYTVAALPFGDGYVLRVNCIPGVRELKKNAEFNAKRLTHFIKTGEKEKQVGPKIKMTILKY